MGREAQIPTTVIDVPNLPVASLTEQQQKMSTLSQEISQRFGDGLPYDRSRVVNEARFYMAQSAEAMLEAGKRLIVLKENEAHGEFESILREQLGLPERTAQVMMQASFKYLSSAVAPKAQALALLGKTKLFELMTESDEALVGLTEGGSIAGLTLDDIDRMTSRELKSALRESREDSKAQARLLEDKNSKLDELATKLTKKQSQIVIPTPDEEAAAIRAEACNVAFSAETSIRGDLNAALQALAIHSEKSGIPHNDYMSGLLAQVQLALNQLRDEFDIKAVPDGEIEPEWVREEADDALAKFKRQQAALPLDSELHHGNVLSAIEN
ncbi:DUF3102 domain-containing protein [uncultured Deefgea sp.]|uniref:DUF3102 domain-containing protein n=1 Tax=uncultured Deefgea sp. TaxID=1304914 RepID=UPI0025958803|nr:DUF3102 domain-containing protein [uncultured Deefgea sp.]